MLKEQVAQMIKDWGENEAKYLGYDKGYGREIMPLVEQILNLFRAEIGSPNTRIALKNDISSYSEVYHISISEYDQWQIVDRIMKKLLDLMRE